MGDFDNFEDFSVAGNNAVNFEFGDFTTPTSTEANPSHNGFISEEKDSSEKNGTTIIGDKFEGFEFAGTPKGDSSPHSPNRSFTFDFDSLVSDTLFSPPKENGHHSIDLSLNDHNPTPTTPITTTTPISPTLHLHADFLTNSTDTTTQAVLPSSEIPSSSPKIANVKKEGDSPLPMSVSNSNSPIKDTIIGSKPPSPEKDFESFGFKTNIAPLSPSTSGDFMGFINPNVSSLLPLQSPKADLKPLDDFSELINSPSTKKTEFQEKKEDSHEDYLVSSHPITPHVDSSSSNHSNNGNNDNNNSSKPSTPSTSLTLAPTLLNDADDNNNHNAVRESPPLITDDISPNTIVIAPVPTEDLFDTDTIPVPTSPENTDSHIIPSTNSSFTSAHSPIHSPSTSFSPRIEPRPPTNSLLEDDFSFFTTNINSAPTSPPTHSSPLRSTPSSPPPHQSSLNSLVNSPVINSDHAKDSNNNIHSQSPPLSPHNKVLENDLDFSFSDTTEQQQQQQQQPRTSPSHTTQNEEKQEEEDFGRFEAFSGSPTHDIASSPTSPPHTHKQESSDDGDQDFFFVSNSASSPTIKAQPQKEESTEFGSFSDSFEQSASLGDFEAPHHNKPLETTHHNEPDLEEKESSNHVENGDFGDFGDFGSFTAPVAQKNTEEFNDFQDSKIEIDDISSINFVSSAKPPDDNDEDGFGEFGDFGSFSAASASVPTRLETHSDAPRDEDFTVAHPSTSATQNKEEDEFGEFGDFGSFSTTADTQNNNDDGNFGSFEGSTSFEGESHSTSTPFPPQVQQIEPPQKLEEPKLVAPTPAASSIPSDSILGKEDKDVRQIVGDVLKKAFAGLTLPELPPPNSSETGPTPDLFFRLSQMPLSEFYGPEKCPVCFCLQPRFQQSNAETTWCIACGKGVGEGANWNWKGSVLESRYCLALKIPRLAPPPPSSPSPLLTSSSTPISISSSTTLSPHEMLMKSPISPFSLASLDENSLDATFITTKSQPPSSTNNKIDHVFSEIENLSSSNLTNLTSTPLANTLLDINTATTTTTQSRSRTNSTNSDSGSNSMNINFNENVISDKIRRLSKSESVNISISNTPAVVTTTTTTTIATQQPQQPQTHTQKLINRIPDLSFMLSKTLVVPQR